MLEERDIDILEEELDRARTAQRKAEEALNAEREKVRKLREGLAGVLGCLVGNDDFENCPEEKMHDCHCEGCERIDNAHKTLKETE